MCWIYSALEESKGEEEGGFLAIKDSGRFLKSAPNPILTPLHMGHFRLEGGDKLNYSEESPFQTASHCRCTLTKLLTNTKKGSHCILGGGGNFNFRYGSRRKLGHCRLWCLNCACFFLNTKETEAYWRNKNDRNSVEEGGNGDDVTESKKSRKRKKEKRGQP